VKLLLDEMYSAGLAEALRAANVDATMAAELGHAGRSDFDVFAPAVADGYVLLTENVADFARIAADHLTAAQHHPSVLIALSSRVSRRPAGPGVLVAAVLAAATSRSRTASSTCNRPIGSEPGKLGIPAPAKCLVIAGFYIVPGTAAVAEAAVSTCTPAPHHRGRVASGRGVATTAALEVWARLSGPLDVALLSKACHPSDRGDSVR
jgi:predicted nuclease of predicted toxin-antitoxin system